MSGFEKLLSVVRALRGENGCPWDKAQTPLSLRRFLVEECFEAVDAIGQGDALHVKEELGDVFFNVLLDASIYEENGDFTIDECFDAIAEKLIRRHPHVFQNSSGESQKNADISLQWERIKENVEGRKGSIFDDVPLSFPPLLRSSKLISKAAKRGFSWENADEARKKVLEEFSEVEKAAVEGNAIHLEEEIGDLLFSVSCWAKMLGVDPTLALSRANAKFQTRVEGVETRMKKRGLSMDENHRAQMAECWKEEKAESI